MQSQKREQPKRNKGGFGINEKEIYTACVDGGLTAKNIIRQQRDKPINALLYFP